MIIPWRESDRYRTAARDHVLTRLAAAGFDDIHVGECPPGPWVKGLAVADGLARTSADVVIIHDADVWCDNLRSAIGRVTDGSHRWAIPHRTVRRLTREATLRVLDGGAPSRSHVERAYLGVQGGGITVIDRALYEEAPLDPRFIGWGQEDLAAGVTWHTLAGRPWRGTADLWHLWHPPQPKLSPAVGSRESQLLLLRYREAAHDVERLRALIAEARSYDTVDRNVVERK